MTLCKNESADRRGSRVYETPAVVYESELEVRAGSPLSIPDPLDTDDFVK